MPRMRRLKYYDPREGYYHIISRTVLKSFLIKEREKEFFSILLRKLSRVYFVKIPTFSVMSNHFHIVLQMIPMDEFSDDEIKRRFERYYNEGIPAKWHRKFDKSLIPQLKQRWGNISVFVQDLKQRFSRWYNRNNNGHGHVWSERFKSVMLQSDRALLACMVYVELNSVRAGIVKRPEEYRYCGLNEMIKGGRSSRWLDIQSLKDVIFSENGVAAKNEKQLIKNYLTIIYQAGMIEKEGKASISNNIADKAIKENFKDINILSFRNRIKYFTEGVILGEKSFCDRKFQEFRSYFIRKKDVESRLIVGQKSVSDSNQGKNLLNIYSIRSFGSS